MIQDTNHENAIKALKNALAAETAAVEDLKRTLAEKEEKHEQLLDNRQSEIEGLQGVVGSLQDEIQKLSDEQQKEFDEKVAKLKEQHDIEMMEATEKLERLNESQQAELEKGSEALAQQVAELTESLNRKEADYRVALETAQTEAATQIEAVQKTRDDEMEGMVAQHDQQQRTFDETIGSLKREAAESAQEKERIWEQRLADVQAASADGAKALSLQLESLKSDHERGSEEVDALKATLAALSHDLTVSFSFLSFYGGFAY